MKTRTVLLLVALLGWNVLSANEFHPEFTLLDTDGVDLLASGRPLSISRTCGACHDTAFIRDSSDHRAAGALGDGEMDCLVCHAEPGVRAADVTPEWLAAGRLNIHKPRDGNCAQCHGIISNDLEVPLTVPSGLEQRGMTDRTGEIISPQKISNSGLNIAGKESLTHPFDVHADRVVGCVNCHYSLNNPVYFQQRKESRPVHLDFDPRRLGNSEYLERPLHQLAKGNAVNGLNATESENSMRRCEGCHDAENVHEWLPYKARHFDALACESCHVPKLYGPALQALDWTLVDAVGQPLRQYRRVDGDPATADGLIQGFVPLLLPRDNVGEARKLAPFNLVSSWYWTAGESGERLDPERLAQALYSSGSLNGQVLALLDADGDGHVSADEFRLDTEAKAEGIRQLLEAGGLEDVRLAAEVTPYPISHSVVNGRWANRDCRHCHEGDSVLGAAFTLSDYLPGGLAPSLAGPFGDTLQGRVNSGPAGGAQFEADSSANGFYVLGHDSVSLVDLAGLAMFLGITFGVSGHAFARWMSGRGRQRRNHPRKRVHMYDAYERLWHWLQAGAILTLVFTGLVIHKPQFFGILSFPYVVHVHNVLGFILLINAALALFYTVASGTIKRFMPEPKGFFGRAIAQTAYYTRGIFAGEPHPLEKTKEKRLNPLQQLTYLAILNILLPAQVITGVLIWGMQEWPQLAASLGGLPVLAPVHTFLAWAFCAFIVMHVYLTTAAGETPTAGIKSMVTGWEDVEMSHRETVNV